MAFCDRSATVPQVAGPCSAGWRAQSASKYSRVSLLMPALSLTAAASVGLGVEVDAGVDVAVGGLPVVAPGVLVLDEPPQAVRARVSVATPSSRTRMGHWWPRVLESELGYLTYAMYEFATWEEMLEDQGFQHLRLGWSFLSVRKEDEGQVLGTVLPVARETADRVALAWEEEADRALTSYCEGKPELYQDIRRLARMGATKHVLEHLRHEVLGRNSSSEQEPHPHSSCAASILEAGQVHPFPRDFEEGMGYKPGRR